MRSVNTNQVVNSYAHNLYVWLLLLNYNFQYDLIIITFDLFKTHNYVCVPGRGVHEIWSINLSVITFLGGEMSLLMICQTKALVS